MLRTLSASTMQCLGTAPILLPVATGAGHETNVSPVKEITADEIDVDLATNIGFRTLLADPCFCMNFPASCTRHWDKVTERTWVCLRDNRV